MKQQHILLIYRFPEDDQEVVMQYTAWEKTVAEADARVFTQMYPGVLFVAVAYVLDDGREEELYRWNNPLAASLTSLTNNVGAASLSPLTMSGSAPTAGSFFRKLNKRFTDRALASRPPSGPPSESAAPNVSKTYGGRNRRTRRGPLR